MPRFKAPSGIAAPVVVCLLLGALGGVGTALVTKPEARAQPVRFTVPREAPPSFRLRDEHGVWRTPASARGDVLVVTFIFTRCRDLCPRQAAEIKDAVLRAGGGVQVYAITVDRKLRNPAVIGSRASTCVCEKAPEPTSRRSTSLPRAPVAPAITSRGCAGRAAGRDAACST